MSPPQIKKVAVARLSVLSKCVDSLEGFVSTRYPVTRALCQKQAVQELCGR